MNNRYTLWVQIITAVVALVGALGAAYMTSNFGLEGARAQIEKDRLVLSANNASENAKEIRKRAELYLVSLSETLEFLDNDRVYVDEAKKRIAKMDKLAQGLLVYAGAELGVASIRVNQDLKNALISSSKEEFVNDLESVMNSARDWYPVYFSVISSYDHHAMPEKGKAHFQQPLIESLLKGLNKSIQSSVTRWLIEALCVMRFDELTLGNRRY